MRRRLIQLVLGTLLLWLVAAYPVRHLGGNHLLILSLVAVLLCLVPTTLTLAWGTWAMKQTADQQLLMMLGGTGLRLGVALGVGLALYILVPFFQDNRFWTCLLAAYLVTLGLEMVLLLRPRASANGEGVKT